MIKAILFDLDGTLLPMDQEEFTAGYFKLLAKKLLPLGYQPNEIIDAVWRGTKAMILNDGEKTNEEVFWEKFSEIYGEKAITDKPIFEEFYQIDFQSAKAFCGYNPKAAETVRRAKERGKKTGLATNPIFPKIATESRARWAGLSVEDFEIVTVYENSRYSKPNPKYYKAVADAIGVSCEECLMVGNDATEDTAAEKVGMKVFLVTDCLINKENKDISKYPQGSFDDLMKYIEKI